MAWWIWVLIGFSLLALEFVASTMHSAFFAAGALFVALLVTLNVAGPLWAQILVFTLFSLATLFLIRPYVVKKLRLSETKIVDTMIGEQATALDELPVAGFGKAEMRGSTWNAQNIGETALPRGARCTVEKVEGLVLHVRG
jgi:membrane protein implicated in regulation of membrane protease activity